MMFWKRSLETLQYQAIEETISLAGAAVTQDRHAWDVNLWLDWDDPEDPPETFSLRAYRWAVSAEKKP